MEHIDVRGGDTHNTEEDGPWEMRDILWVDDPGHPGGKTIYVPKGYRVVFNENKLPIGYSNYDKLGRKIAN